VLGLALLFEGAVWLVALRAFRQNKGRRGWLEAVRLSKDPTVFTVLFEDTAALMGLLVALVGIWLSQALEMPVLDGVASLVIGIILAGTAAFLAWECQSLLTGEGVSPEVQASIRAICMSCTVSSRSRWGGRVSTFASSACVPPATARGSCRGPRLMWRWRRCSCARAPGRP
jgi:divalent metal cation (Fe/Co/Zn/Cd) transporter